MRLSLILNFFKVVRCYFEMDATSSNSGFVTEATIFSGIVTKTWDFHIDDERHTVAVRHSTLDGFRYVLVRFFVCVFETTLPYHNHTSGRW